MVAFRGIFVALVLAYGYSLCLATEDPVAIFLSHIDNETDKLWHQLKTDTDHVFLRSDLQSFIHSYDTDNDGHVMEIEFLNHWLKNDPELIYVGHGMFVEFDVNVDYVVDDADLDGIYNKIDINGDGRVDEPEFKDYFKQLLTVLYLIHIHNLPDPGAPAAV